ncbi:MAG: hypothetical protein R6T87_12395, partial [Marinobacter sp.]
RSCSQPNMSASPSRWDAAAPGKEKPLPNHLRWAVLKRGQVNHLTANQLVAIAEMTKQGLVGDRQRLDPVRKALATLKTHTRGVVQRWVSEVDPVFRTAR